MARKFVDRKTYFTGQALQGLIAAGYFYKDDDMIIQPKDFDHLAETCIDIAEVIENKMRKQERQEPHLEDDD